eukprot:jgi/Tetstr1/455041/TSEL_041897.t1
MGASQTVVTAVVVFLLLQLVIFAGYHFNIIQLEEEAEIEHELQHQLRELMEDNDGLQGTAEQLRIGLATERARRTGLELQLLQAGVLPHEMEVQAGSEEYAELERELAQRRAEVESRVSSQHKVLMDSFINTQLAGAAGVAGNGMRDVDVLAQQIMDDAAALRESQRMTAQQGQHLPANPMAAAAAARAQAARTSHQVAPAALGKVVPVPVSNRIFPASNEDHPCPVLADPAAPAVTAGVVVVAFNRQDYLERTLNSISAARNHKHEWADRFPLYVSQDGSYPGIKDVVVRHKDFGYLNHLETQAPQPLTHKENLAYYRISNHYKFILGVMFDCLQYKKAIILEDDMQLSMDFFEYFSATAPLLDKDKTLYTVSSWNDHGQSQFVANSSQLYRSDFFPGLGWMLTKDLWEELKPKWPRAYWDDWMRQTQHRKDRQSIRPEVCRTFNFGEQGTSRGQFYKKYLATIHLNSEYVNFQQMKLDYLLQPEYEAAWDSMMAGMREVPVEEAMRTTGDVKVVYDSQETYEAITGKLGMLREWKDGVPRGAYKGVVPVRFNKARIFIAPEEGFQAEERITGMVDGTGALVKRKPGASGPGRPKLE